MTATEDDEQDLTRKQRREQARATRREVEQQELASAQRRKRLTQLGIVGGIVIAVIVAILVATAGGSSKHSVTENSSQEKELIAEVGTLLNGIPQSGNTLGAADAPVTLQYFGDLECPICREFTLGALPDVIRKWVRAGKLKIEYHSLETATKEPETFKSQQVAALAAGKQNKMWDYVELFYHQQGEEDSGYVTEEYLHKLARQVPGLDLASWTTARGDNTLSEMVTSDGQAANNAGFTGTPSFLIGKSGAAMTKLEYASLTDPSSFDAAIEKLLKS